jgi:glycosyltransferase involved in cell wall biosynthesis
VAFPVCGDLESIREWIDDGVNGFLVDPTDAQALAGAIESFAAG